MATRLAEIYRSEKKTGGGLASSIGKSLKEKIDPRQMLDQSGLLVSMFPSLKSFNATRGKGVAEKVSSNMGGGIDNSILNALAATSSLTAKNSMSLPMMARDMNLMKLNIFKLVKLQGGSANTTKTDMFWKNAQARESAYENTIGKIAGDGMIGKMAKSAFVGKQKRDGQSPGSALFVTGGSGGGVQASEVAEGILTAGVLKKIMTSTVGFMASPVGLSILGVAAGGVAIAGLARKLQDDQIDKAAERGDVKEVKQQLKNQALGGESELYLSPEDSVGIDKALNEIAEDRVNKLKKPTKLEIEAQAASERLKNLPDTGAGGGRGFINPTLVTPEAEIIPPNVVRSGSGQAPTSPAPAADMSAYKSRAGVGREGSSSSPATTPSSPSPMSSTATSGGKSTSPTKAPTALDITASTESGGRYDLAFGDVPKKDGTIVNILGKSPKNFPQLAGKNIMTPEQFSGKPLTEMTLAEVQAFQNYRNQEAPNTNAVGKYQFMRTTLFGKDGKSGLVGQSKLPMNTIFNANTQELLQATMREGNAATLRKLGVSSTDANLNLANAVGAKGVAKLLKPENANRNALDVLGLTGASAETNPQLNRLSKDVIAATYSKYDARGMAPGGSSGTVLASASTSVADQRMAAMAPSGGNTVINNKPVNVASNAPSSGGKTASTYDNELFQTLVGYQSA